MKLLICLTFTLLAVTSPAYAQHPAAKFDEFGDIYCDDEKARLDNFANQMLLESDATGYIIFYGGRRYRRYAKAGWRLPRRGDAEARVSRMKPYMVDTRANLNADRIVVINGGFRDTWMAEIWIVPRGATPPKPTPTVDSKAIKFSRRRVRKQDYYCSV